MPSLGLILICRWNIEQGICDWFRLLTRDMKNSLFTKFLPRKEKSVRSLTPGLAAVCFTASGRWQILFVRWQWCRGRIIATGALKVWWEKWLWEKPLVPPFTDPSISLSLSLFTHVALLFRFLFLLLLKNSGRSLYDLSIVEGFVCHRQWLARVTISHIWFLL